MTYLLLIALLYIHSGSLQHAETIRLLDLAAADARVVNTAATRLEAAGIELTVRSVWPRGFQHADPTVRQAAADFMWVRRRLVYKLLQAWVQTGHPSQIPWVDESELWRSADRIIAEYRELLADPARNNRLWRQQHVMHLNLPWVRHADHTTVAQAAIQRHLPAAPVSYPDVVHRPSNFTQADLDHYFERLRDWVADPEIEKKRHVKSLLLEMRLEDLNRHRPVGQGAGDAQVGE